MSVSGKVVILTMVGAAVAAAGFGQWYHYSTTRRALELWGGEAANLINRAAKVEALRLAPADGNEAVAELLMHGGQRLEFVESADITAARGLVHARRALVEDANFDWDDAGGDCDPHWTYALRFTSGQDSVTLLLALECHRIKRLDSPREVSLRPTLTAGLTTFLGEQFAERGE